jgi:hypothetical protein
MPLSVIELDAQARKTGADRAWLAAERAYEAVYSMTGPVCIKKRGIVFGVHRAYACGCFRRISVTWYAGAGAT